ncbi:type VI secretion system-associated FHA domain protein [Limnobacter parvus]|uniref:FHA domain-containing protein n=1 Tax=Limnobacter parvus TaxID=2939690 RepID=A0ABT1XIP6_9BURK|nr:type VI secretion system-associated FHA domain protein [Limnobacter parvus]MCR2747158.1 FHA domain-containing protein [Limnobacter parvus]
MNSSFQFKVDCLQPSTTSLQPWPVPLHGGIVGRSQECTWVLDDPNRIVSRQHARIHIDDAQCYWTDLGTNSTQVNGKPMPQGEQVRLNLGDVLKIGDYLLTLEMADAHWSGLDALLPRQEVDPLESLMPQAEPALNIDDLLADLSPASQHQAQDSVSRVPVLAQRMYVGSQGAQVNRSIEPEVPLSNAAQPATEKELENLRYLLGIGVQGCMQLLQARRVFKEEMGGDLTTISGKANNPLKFSSSPEEAMARLLGEPSQAYLPADQALQQAFQDVLIHMQLSVARIQTTIEQMQTTFDPQVIMAEATRQGGLAMGLSATRKARLWDLYCERYQKLNDTWN